MSECLGPPLSVCSSLLVIYSSPLVIYSSSLFIYSCSLLDAFITDLFKCYLHMTYYFLSLFKQLATIILQQLSILFLNIFFPTIFHATGWLYVINTPLSFHWGSMSSMSQYIILNKGILKSNSSIFPWSEEYITQSTVKYNPLPSGKGLYLTVYSSSCPNMDTVFF